MNPFARLSPTACGHFTQRRLQWLVGSIQTSSGA